MLLRSLLESAWRFFFSKSLCLAADSSDLAGHRAVRGSERGTKKREGVGYRERDRQGELRAKEETEDKKKEGVVGK